MAQGVFGLQARDVVAHVRPKVFHLIFGEGVVFGIPFLGLRQALAVGTVQLGLMRKLVVQELVEENLGDDLVLVSVVAQARIATHGLKRIYQVDGSLLNIHICFSFLMMTGCPPAYIGRNTHRQSRVG